MGRDCQKIFPSEPDRGDRGLKEYWKPTCGRDEKGEAALADDYDAMYNEQPRATEILADETPDICASAEPGMRQEEIEKFKERLKREYERTLKYVV